MEPVQGWTGSIFFWLVQTQSCFLSGRHPVWVSTSAGNNSTNCKSLINRAFLFLFCSLLSWYILCASLSPSLSTPLLPSLLLLLSLSCLLIACVSLPVTTSSFPPFLCLTFFSTLWGSSLLTLYSRYGHSTQMSDLDRCPSGIHFGSLFRIFYDRENTVSLKSVYSLYSCWLSSFREMLLDEVT